MISLLQADNLSKRYGEKLLFEGISIHISESQKLAIVAKNGTGKTSLLNILAGVDTGDTGKITMKRNLRIAYLPQDIVLNPEKTVLEAVFFQDDEIITAIREYNDCIAGEDHSGLQPILDKMDRLNAWDYDSRVKQILGKLKITEYTAKIKHLSGGQKKRIALAGTLISEPELLILDEPTNHLDLDMIEWLENYLDNSGMTILMVTHDRYFLDRVCNSIIEMDRGQIFTYQGNYSYFVEKRAERIDNLQANIDRAQNLMRTEQEWIRRMPKARTHKSKYRIAEFGNIKSVASQRTDEKKLEMGISAERLGKKVIDIYNVSKSYGDKCLIKDFSYKIARFEKIGIVGNNGCGKTTLLNIIMGVLNPDKGRIEIGNTVKIAYYNQDGISFDEDSKPIDIVKNIAETVQLKNGKTFSASGFLQYFLFSQDMQYTLVRKLSGGEKRRLYLCTVLMTQPNVLLMDEPTNDLDIMTLQVLEEYLSETEASVIIVSHDRFFMDKIVDHVFVFGNNGQITDFPGNYTQYRDSDIYGLDENGERNSLNPVNSKNSNLNKNENNPKLDKPKKMSFKDKFEFEKLETELAEMHILKHELELLLNSGGLNHEELLQKSNEYSELLNSIANKEMRWLELSEL
ncbi:MAG: ABC-F family ATP-binding cassette domain-containing protein, partial [Bacteroidales bacterium]|nr:ABC-F family ATP-binding cassette domain-containing protein [Bacteroidales bacterium]